MIRTGTLIIEGNDSRLDGTLLALCQAPSPLNAATSFLKNRNLLGGRITVTGEPGKIGGVDVFCMTDAHRAPQPDTMAATIRTGTLSVVDGQSRLDNGTLLARCAEPSPAHAATNFLQSKNLVDGRITVTGEPSKVEGIDVFCVFDANRAP